jgi:hypothetical protein
MEPAWTGNEELLVPACAMTGNGGGLLRGSPVANGAAEMRGNGAVDPGIGGEPDDGVGRAVEA